MTDPKKLSVESPLIVRLGAWANERFPLANAVLFLVLYAAALAFGRMLASGGEIFFGTPDILGFLAVWAFFLMLRVFDEHKDYELDCHNHPDRVLQSGVITLGHLKVLGVLAIVVQGAVSFYLADGWGKIPMFWLIAFVWSLLMAVEFFCGEWLEKRLVLYAFSHMVVMPMALIWMAQMGAGEAELSADVALLAGLSFLSGAAFEVTRKMKAPEDERDTIDSYTRVFGTTRAPLVVLFLLTAGVAMLAFLLGVVFPQGVAPWWYGVLAATLAPAFFALMGFRKTPSAKAAKKCEGMVALAMLAGYVILLAAIWVERGVRWV